ncbi:MAG: type II toxin-antitoxin system PemK/MazF family toxin [Myxococcaceae bacterium]
MKQYEIWWASFPKPIGRRPVLLLSRTPAFLYLSKVLVAEVTTTIRNIPQEVRLGRTEGLRHPCVANFDNLHVVSKASLVERVGRLEPRRVHEVKRAVGAVFGWPELLSA